MEIFLNAQGNSSFVRKSKTKPCDNLGTAFDLEGIGKGDRS